MKKTISALAVCAALAGAMPAHSVENKDFKYIVDRFADIEVLRYEVPAFKDLTPRQKAMVYYLSEAAQAGRDIIWDQNCRYNLPLRVTLEAIYNNYRGDKNTTDYKAFEKYLKQVWFGNGIHHHYSTDKFKPGFSQAFFEEQVNALPDSALPKEYKSKAEVIAELGKVVFDPTFMAKRVNQDGTQDVIATSATNLYGPGVTQAEVEAYFAKVKDPSDPTPISYGLNSRMKKDEKGNLVEEHYQLNGLYGPAIAKIIYNLSKAREYAENVAQKA